MELGRVHERSPQDSPEVEPMPRKQVVAKIVPTPIVTFQFEDRTYEIDPGLRKVYRRFVEIETSKAAEIFSNWRAQHVQV